MLIRAGGVPKRDSTRLGTAQWLGSNRRLPDNVDRSEAAGSRLRDVHRKFSHCGFNALQLVFAVAEKMDRLRCAAVLPPDRRCRNT
jgi:hypothetical protein